MDPRGSPSGDLPAELAARVVAGRASLEGERKLVTILFADLVGSTALASELDPEDMVDLLNELFTQWVTAVHRYEGTVDKFLGDGMLALFGAPLAHEDDPRRAVMAALEIRDATVAFGAEQRHTELNVRVGLNTGTVVVGGIGPDARMEYTAIGDAVNVAQRIESNARPGSVFVGPDTMPLIEPYFELADAGLFELKGKPEPVRLVEVVADLDLPTAARGVSGLHSPVVGRDRELAYLRTAVDRLAEGRGSVICLLGEPGLGKTRLVEEVRRQCDNARWAQGHALSFATGTPYLALSQLVESLDAGPADEDLARLVAGETSPNPDGLPDRVSAALRRLTLEHLPAVFAIDDLHWLDESSLAALDGLIQLTESHPLMILMTSRPEGRGRAEDLRAKQLWLEPLDAEHQLELVGNLLHIDEIPAELRDLIAARSQGNPFFTEEFLRALIDDGSLGRSNGNWQATRLVSALDVPPSLEALVASRIDRLAQSDKGVLQAAAVLGETFDLAVLDRIAPARDVLPRLETAGFLTTSEDPGRRTFKHAITRDVAYGSSLKKKRRGFHLAAADAIESLYPHETDARAAELGRHLDSAGESDRAVPYLMTAARQAAAGYAHKAALHLAERVRSLTDDSGVLFDSWELSAEILGHIGRHDDEWEAVLKLDELSTDEPMRLRRLVAATRSRLGSDYLQAYPLCEEAMEVAARLGDHLTRARLLRMWARLQRWQYAPHRAITALEEAATILTSEGAEREHAEVLAETAGLMLNDDPPKAIPIAEEALHIARAMREPRLLSEALLTAATAEFENDDPTQALAYLDEALVVSEEIADIQRRHRAHRLAGYAGSLAGDSALASRHFLEAIDVGARSGDALAWLGGALGLVEHLEMSERWDELHSWLVEVAPEVEASGHSHNRAYLHYARGYRLLRWMNRLEEAESHLRRSWEFTDETPEWKPPAVMFRNGMAAVLLDAGRIDEAGSVLEEAKTIAAEHELEAVTGAYLQVTEVRMRLAQGELVAALPTLERLRQESTVESLRGERHAVDVLAAEIALAAGQPPKAVEYARAAMGAEPLRGTNRWFGSLEVADLLVRAEGTAGVASSLNATSIDRMLSERLRHVPAEFVDSFSARPEVMRLREIIQESQL